MSNHLLQQHSVRFERGFLLQTVKLLGSEEREEANLLGVILTGFFAPDQPQLTVSISESPL